MRIFSQISLQNIINNIIRNQHKYIIFLFLAINIILAIYVRLVDVSYDTSALEGTDAVRYTHQAKQIVESGHMPEIDRFRSAPLGEKTSNQLTFYPYVIAGICRLMDIIHINVKIEQFAIISPILFFVITILITFVMVRRIFDNYIALLFINIVIFVPPLVAITAAGSADRDSLVLLLSTVSFLFYLLSHINGFNYKKWIYVFLSASFMLLTGLTWQGVGVFIAIVTTTELVGLLTDRLYSYKKLIFFACWALPVSVGLIILKPDVYRYLSQPYAFVAVIYPLFCIFVSMLVCIVQHSRNLMAFLSFRNRLPIGVSVSFCLGVFFLILNCNAEMKKLFSAIAQSFISPLGTDPLFQTIGELQKLGLLGWALWPGAFLILMAVGLLLVNQNICKTLNLHQYWTMGFIEIIVFGIAFSRIFSNVSTVNFIETSVTLTIYWGSIGIGILGLISGFIHAYWKRSNNKSSSIDHITLIRIFLVIWSMFMFILLRSAIRFIFLFVIPGTIIGAYAAIWIFRRYIQKGKQSLLYLLYVLLISWQVYTLFIDKMNWYYISTTIYILLAILTISIIFLIIKYTSNSGILHKLGITAFVLYIIGLTSMSPSPAFGGYTFEIRKKLTPVLLIKEKPIQNALEWIRDNTNKDAVIAANWEYGCWLNLLSNRATIVDEQQRRKWTNFMAKELFLGDNITNSLEFLKTHEADYLFLTKRNIDFLNMIARESGVQEKYGEILFFGNIIQKTNITNNNKTSIECYRYCRPDWQSTPGMFNLRLDNKEYSAKQWCIYSIYLQLEMVAGSIKPVKALLELQLDGKKVKYIAPQSIYYKKDILHPGNKECLPGSIIVDTETGDMNDPTKWHIIYLDPQTQQLLPIQIFLLGGMPEIFERVYPPPGCKDPSEYEAQVWKIHYPSGIKARPEYLEMGSLAPTDF